MTALLYLLEPQRVCIAMDSLVLDAESKKPLKYTTKLFVLPHLRGLMCGTGSLDLLLSWFAFVQKMVVAVDMLFLDRITSHELRKISSQLGQTGDLSTTIYHFGFHAQENRFVGFAYRSANNYNSEQLIYSLGIKPDDGDLQEIALPLIQEKGLPEGFVDLVNRQRVQDNQKPVHERVGIGGEVHFAMLDPSQSFVCVSHRFDDYSAVFQEMLDHLSVRMGRS